MTAPALEITDLNGWRGSAHVLQDLTMVHQRGRLGIIGRNGMGKTTLCEAITGILGLGGGNRTSGSIKIYGTDVLGTSPHRIARLGVGYVPQGRRVFRSLSVEENLVVASRRGRWTVASVYDLFPRLAERRSIGAANLSGGEQQMLAVGRALVTQPRLLIMDEPSEGLAPVIVEHLLNACRRLADEGMDVMVVEQNLSAAVNVADDLLVVANGRITDRVRATVIEHDAELQRRHLGFDTNLAPGKDAVLAADTP